MDCSLSRESPPPSISPASSPSPSPSPSSPRTLSSLPDRHISLADFCRRELIGHQGRAFVPSPFPLEDFSPSLSLVGLSGCPSSVDRSHRPLFYADWTATGRALKVIEHFVMHSVLPRLANTHTASSFAGIHTNLLREEARRRIATWTQCSDDDELIFAGTGSTGAFAKLFAIFQQTLKEERERKGNEQTSENVRAVYVIGPYAHHSTLLPLRESGAEIIEIAEDFVNGGPQIKQLETALASVARQIPPPRIKAAFFVAASNLSGILCNVDHITRICHIHGFLACWDYAAGISFIDVRMSPPGDAASAKDVVYFSPHKMLGGLSTPGVLLVKKRLLVNAVPSHPAGGTIFFVSPSSHRYLQNFAEREEGGTPDAVGAIRAGLAFELCHQFDPQWKNMRMKEISHILLTRLCRHPSIVIAGSMTAPRLPIVSFLLRSTTPSKRFLHPNYVATLLSDLFGVQSRSGCLCVGPYAHICLGLSDENSSKIERCLIDRFEVLRPGFTRVSVNICVSDAELEFLCRSVEFVAEYGQRLLPLYVYHIDTGEWKHRSRINRLIGRTWLSDILHYDTDSAAPPQMVYTWTAKEVEPMFTTALQAVEQADKCRSLVSLQQSGVLPTSAESLRWYLTSADLNEPPTANMTASLSIQPPSNIPLANISSTPSNVQNLANQRVESDVKGALSLCNILPDWVLEEEQCVSLLPRLVLDNDNTAVQLRQVGAGTCEEQKQVVVTNNYASIIPVGKEISSPLPSLRCQACYHFHMNGSERGRCSTCDCIHFSPYSDQPSLHNSASAQLSYRSERKELQVLTSKLNGLMSRAIREHEMIRSGDRILVGVSGGKDSLSLIHLLLSLRKRSPVKFELGAVTVDPAEPNYDPSPLIGYFQRLGMPYFYERQHIIEQARQNMNNRVSICAYCARMKRGIIYNTARREGYNVIALGQHGDDLAESCIMSLFFNGRLRSMKAHYTIAKGDLRVIRPLVKVREWQTRLFARLSTLPVISENCPACFAAPQERARVKQMLASQETLHPNLIAHILSGIEPLVEVRRTGVEGHKHFLHTVATEEEIEC